MKDPITAFVEQNRQLLIEFATGWPQSNDGPGAAQRHFVASFTRTIDDFVDSLHDQGNRQPDSELFERGAALRQRFERVIKPAAAGIPQREYWRQNQAMTY